MMSFETKIPLHLQFLIFFPITDFVWDIYCVLFGMAFQEDMYVPLSLPFVRILLIFPVSFFMLSFFIMAWAEHSACWFPCNSGLLSAWRAAKFEQVPGCFVSVGRLFLFAFVLLKGLSAASCNLV